MISQLNSVCDQIIMALTTPIFTQPLARTVVYLMRRRDEMNAMRQL